MTLPDIEFMYPQREPRLFSKCTHIRCGLEIYENDEYIEAAGNPYCDKICAVDQMLLEGTVKRGFAEI